MLYENTTFTWEQTHEKKSQKHWYFLCFMLCSCWTLSVVSSLRSSLQPQGALLVLELSKRDPLLLAWTSSLSTSRLHCHLQVHQNQLTPFSESKSICHWGAHAYVRQCVCQWETQRLGRPAVRSHPTRISILISDFSVVILIWTGNGLIFLPLRQTRCSVSPAEGRFHRTRSTWF